MLPLLSLGFYNYTKYVTENHDSEMDQVHSMFQNLERNDNLKHP